MTPRAMLVRLRRALAPYNLARIANPLFDLSTGGRRRPVFYDVAAVAPSLAHLDEAYPAIRAELEELLVAQDAMPKYHELDPDLLQSSGRFHRDRRWNVFMLFCYGARLDANRELCPATCAALDRVEGLLQAFFSILDPGKSIPAHTGPTRAYLRYHLALRVPRNDPPSIRIRDRHYTWREGESVLFDDSWEHEITNHSDGVRAVLIVDVMRPLPAPLSAIAAVMRRLAWMFYGPRVAANARKFTLPRK